MLKKMLQRLMVVAAVVVAGFCAAPNEGEWQVVSTASTSVDSGKVSPVGSQESPGRFRRTRVPRRGFRAAPADWLNFKTASPKASDLVRAGDAYKA